MIFISTISHNIKEQFQVNINSIKENSFINNIIQEKIEIFITKFKIKLNILSVINLIDDEISNFKDEIHFILK